MLMTSLIRIISALLTSLVFLSFSGVSSASTITYWGRYVTDHHSSALLACKQYGSYMQVGNINPTYASCYNNTPPSGYVFNVTKFTANCPFGDSGSTCNASCNSPMTMVDGQCVAPPPNPCTAKSGQATTWRKEYDSQSAYQSSPIYETTSQGGCGVTDLTLQCGTSGSTGKFGCWGTGTYSGEPEEPTTGGGPIDDCGQTCIPPEPTASDSSRSCTAPQVNGGTTSHTCVTSSNSDQWSSSNCSVGTVNGVTALHCTKPDYVPEAGTTTKTDNTTQTTNPDGGKTTVTESTTTKTSCKAGVCTTSTTKTTTTTGTDANGNTTGESTECEGDKCDDPATPQDESTEEEEEEVERTVSGESCASDISCEGDAIDCAVLRQQKAMRCSLDWETQKGSVLSEASKPEYQLETSEIDASSLFSGPSAARWLSSSCPADRVIYLETAKRSVTFSWSMICQYASTLSYMFVFGASLFFAVYVGRAFGGD